MSDLRTILGGIYAKRGELTPPGVVDEARDEAHPLHHRFEWNDSIAGEKYRQVQAAEIIRSVKITYSAAEGVKQVRGFLPISRDVGDETKRTYAPTEEVLENEFQRQLVLREAMRDWKQLRARYEHLREFADLIRNDLRDAS